MDTLSQAVVGAALAQSFAKKNEVKIATVAGVMGGLISDLDVLISSKVDPLLQIEYHRSFSHSFLFVPILALPISLILRIFTNEKVSFGRIYWFSLLGVLTHGLLDACTSYGTQLFWPFSNYRVAWNIIAIIDPLFTLPVLAAVIWVYRRNNPFAARAIHVFMFAYFMLGVFQRDHAEKAGLELAQNRGLTVIRNEAKPSMGNLVLWRSIVETSSHDFYVDAIHVIPFLEPKIYPGAAVPRWKSPVDLSPESIAAKDVARFDWFSDHYLARHPQFPEVIGDLRYATIPSEIEPLWGIVVGRPDAHVRFETFRVVNKEIWQKFRRMLFRQNLP